MTAEIALTAGALVAAFPYLRQRLQLSRAKHPSLAGHSRMAKRVARWIPGYAYDESEFFNADRVSAEVVARRRAGFFALAQALRERSPRTLAMTREARDGLSDLQFTSRYRVPFQFSPIAAEHLQMGAFWESASGVMLRDLDGNEDYDLTGSYGVNVFGVDFYKECMAEGARLGTALGPVLGGYHSCVASNIARLQEISGLAEVSFHMSGTEAVMQAVRLARYHTGRRYLVRFCGAYHGWWDDVQPGPGSPTSPRDTYTLKDMDDESLRVLRTRKDIACVLVNPLQALHPNRNAPGDSTLIDSGRDAGFDRATYAAWLQRLRQVCSERGIALIFDEVFVGFRLALGGAQEYFGVRADMVCYGKTVAGGFPVGVVCGRHELMQRYKPKRPADVCFARGTFNSHPYVMGAMHAFLERLQTPAVRAIYKEVDGRWQEAARRFNSELQMANVPVRIAALSSIWTVCYTRPSRYNWMLQFYLKKQQLALSWIGTGRLIFSLNYSDEALREVTRRFIQACLDMQGDGWWDTAPQQSNRVIRRQLLKEMIRRRFF